MEVEALHLAHNALVTVALLGGPILLAGLIVGLAIGLFQAVTSIQEQTLTFIPKMFVMLAVMFYCLPWMTRTMVSFTTQLLIDLPRYGH